MTGRTVAGYDRRVAGRGSSSEVRLSKRLACVLRHDPASAGVVLDPQGWVGVGELLAGLHSTGPAVTRECLAQPATTRSSSTAGAG